MGEVVPDWNELRAKLDSHRERGETVVSTNGVFDVLHIGHVRYLQQARALGDCLVIGINTDNCTARLKGPSRPIVGQAERAELLAALSCVDYVTLFDESTPEALLSVVRPNIHVKGGDYNIEEMPETATVRSHGGRVITVPLVAGRSTTDLVQRILETANGARRSSQMDSGC